MTELRQRQPRQESPAYLAHIRTLHCLICSARGVDPAHIRMGCIGIDKNYTGGGEKPDDKWTLPLCRRHHDEQHDAGSEILFWRHYGIDPFAVAMRLWDAWRATQKDQPLEPKRYKTRSKRSGFKRRQHPFPKVKKPWPARPLKSRGFAK